MHIKTETYELCAYCLLSKSKYHHNVVWILRYDTQDKTIDDYFIIIQKQLHKFIKETLKILIKHW